MKPQIVFLLCLMIVGHHGVGQVWVDQGAVWHLEYSAVGPASKGLYIIEYEKDTLIQGHECKKFITNEYAFANMHSQPFLLGKWRLQDQFTYVSGDTVFYLHSNDFYVLFNFGASIGDSWIISVKPPVGINPLCDDTSRIIVTDTGRITINSESYRYITVEPSSSYSCFGMKGTYVERFGIVSTNYDIFHTVFPGIFQGDSIPGIIEWNYIRFKCFQDTSFGLYNPSGEACDSLLRLIGIQEPEMNHVNLYPNPSSGLVYIDDPMKGEKVVGVYNFQGALIRRFRLNAGDNHFDISDLPHGLYMVWIQDSRGTGKSYNIIRK